jgi:hypothetical protein
MTGSASGSGSGSGPAGGGGGAGTVGGGGTASATCWISYTIVDPHDVGGGGYSEHTYTPKDGTYGIHSYNGGGCIPDCFLWWCTYTCSTLIGTDTRPDNFPTEDCHPDPWTP